MVSDNPALRDEPEGTHLSVYADLLMRCVKKGGFTGPRAPERFDSALQDSWEAFDKIPHHGEHVRALGELINGD